MPLYILRILKRFIKYSYMQGKAIDIMDGIHLIDALKNLGITMRNEVDLYHDRWYTEAVALADKV